MSGIAYIDRKHAELRLDGSAIGVYAAGERVGTVPLGPLGRVVVIGDLLIRSAVLHRLADRGVDVVFLSGKRQRYRGRLVGRHHRHARLRIRQYESSTGPLALRLARAWIGKKLERQLSFLNEALDERPAARRALFRAADIVGQVAEKARAANSLDSLRGLEGGAAAAYFAALSHIFPDGLFNGRSRRPPRDPVNALLSLTYTLVHYEWVRECELIGLDPLVGFYHQLDYGRESLACDLNEPFRPETDRWVWTLFRSRQFTERDFAAEQERAGIYLKKTARGRYYQAYEEWIAPRRAAMRDEVQALARTLVDGEDALSRGESEPAGSQ
ncbi:MAG TPA: CRISPR-associated endonuclease Cas1 [Candidatus Acidoferrales bacterium]|nr:CRISPR-associated endonuclease Cas1 [Candidatus Acidoferrales bacterium]